MASKSQLPLILATAFLDILGLGILIPVLPDIILHFGVSEAWNPYSGGIYSIGMFVWGLIFGWLSDKYGRKNLLMVTTSFNLLGYIITWISLSQGLIPLSLSMLFVLFLIGRAVSGLGGAGFGVVQAYISDISTRENRAKNMGLIGAAFGFAFLVGPALGGILAHWGTQAVILGCMLAVALNLLLIILKLQEPKKHIEEMHTDHVPFHFSRAVITLLVLSFGGTLAFSAIQQGSSQFYKDIFWFDAQHIGYTLSLVGLIAIIYQGWLVKYVRRYLTEIQMIQAATLLMTIGLFLFSWNRSVFWLYIIVATFPVSMGTFQPAIGSLFASKAGKEVGKVMWYNTSVVSIGNIVGPFIVGTLYAVNKPLPFIISAGIAFSLFFLSLTLRKN